MSCLINHRQAEFKTGDLVRILLRFNVRRMRKMLWLWVLPRLTMRSVFILHIWLAGHLWLPRKYLIMTTVMSLHYWKWCNTIHFNYLLFFHYIYTHIHTYILCIICKQFWSGTQKIYLPVQFSQQTYIGEAKSTCVVQKDPNISCYLDCSIFCRTVIVTVT